MLRPVLSTCARKLTAFRRDNRGTVVAEFAIMMPLLIWTMIATFTYWDVYRSMNKVQKAADAVSDALSREPGATTKAYIDGLQKLTDYMIDAELTPKLRASSIRWNTSSNLYEIDWSCSPGGALPKLTNSTVNALSGRLPVMTNALESLLLVEVEVPYKAPLGISSVTGVGASIDVGLQTFKEFVPIPPRYIPVTTLIGPAC